MTEVSFPSPPYETPSGKSLSLSFESEGRDLVLVSLQAADEQTTKVKLEGYSAAFREEMKKAAAVEQAERVSPGEGGLPGESRKERLLPRLPSGRTT